MPAGAPAGPSGVDELTARERDVFDLAVTGATARTIADRFGIGVRTVETHLRAIYRKTGVVSKTELIARFSPGLDGARRPAITTRPVLQTGLGMLEPAVHFVGRTGELALLDDALARLADGAQVVSVTGFSGVGKSSLVAHWVTSRVTSHRLQVVGGRCSAQFSSPFGPVVDALAGFFDASTGPLDDVLGPTGGALALLAPQLSGRVRRLDGGIDSRVLARFTHDALRSALAALVATGDTVLIVEDLHAADPDTIGLVRRLVADALPGPLLTIVTTRNTVPAASGHEAVARDADELDWRRGFDAEVARSSHATKIDLGGLTVADAIALGGALSTVRLTPDTIARCHEATAGNALLLSQLVRHGVDPERPGSLLPDAVTTDIVRRLHDLPESVADLIALAALDGNTIDVAVVDAAARRLGLDRRLDASTLQQAIDVGLVVDDVHAEHPFRFVHDIATRCIADDLSPSRRLRFGSALGHAWIAVHGDTVDGASRAATHLARSLDPDDLVAAAAQLVRVLRDPSGPLRHPVLRTAARELLAALPATPVGEAAALDLGIALAWVAYLCFDAETHASCVADAVEVARRPGAAPDALARVLEVYRTLPTLGDGEPGVLDLVDEALERIPQPHHGALRARVRGYAAYRRALGGHGFAAAPEAERALAEANESGDRPTIAVTWSFLSGVLAGSPDLARCADVVDEVTRWRNRLGDLHELCDARRFEATLALQRGDLARFATVHAALAEDAIRTGHPFFVAIDHMWSAMRALTAGRPEDCPPHLDAMLEQGSDGPNVLLGWLGLSVAVALERGDQATAGALVTAALENHPDLPVARACAARVFACAGDVEAAADALEPFDARGIAALGDDMVLTTTLAWITEASVAIDRLTGPIASAILERFEPYQGQVVVAGTGALALDPVDRHRALALRALGRDGDADRASAGASALAASMPAPGMGRRIRADLERRGAGS